MASLDELLAQLGIGGVARNRAGQIVTNPNDIVSGSAKGLVDMLYGAGRGTVAGTAAIGGIPGDINQMYVNKFGALFPNEPAPPTSEQISKAVKKAIPPLNLSKDNTGNVATSLGENVVSPMIAPETLLGATKATKVAGKYAAPEVGRMAEQYAVKTGLLNSIKPIDLSAKKVTNVSINSAEINARKAIDNLVNQAKAYGIEAPANYSNMPVGVALSDLNQYLGQSTAVTNLPKAAKESLRNLWGNAENAGIAYQRVYGENKLMGKPLEAANKETINSTPPWFSQELEDKFINKEITKKQYESQTIKNMENYFKLQKK